MKKFVFCGKKKIFVDIPRTKLIFKEPKLASLTKEDVNNKIKRFFDKEKNNIVNKKVTVLVPDNTRIFHPKMVLPLLNKYLKELAPNFVFLAALGLHKAMSFKKLRIYSAKNSYLLTWF